MQKEQKQLWGGRFSGSADDFFFKFNQSLSFDCRFYKQDIKLSIAYAKALHKKGVFNADELDSVIEGLQKINVKIESDANIFKVAVESGIEDIHSFVESELALLIGDTAYKLHTGRSRNDQVSTGFRLYCLDAIDGLVQQIKQLQSALVFLGKNHINVFMPGYTHLQKAQPVLWAHYLLSYFEMLKRDIDRLYDCKKRMSTMPLGSGAISGNSWGVDRDFLRCELGFENITQNSLDATSDRDFVAEFLFAMSMTMIHLSRFCEDLILFSSQEFSYIELSDKFATGSSLMPQKKNPDALELIRGKSGRVIGNLQALLVVLKGLPTSYNKDLQEDKEAFFDAYDTCLSCLIVLKDLVEDIKVNPEKMKASAVKGFLNATELADYFCQQGMPFRLAHHLSGQVVLYAIENNKELQELTIKEFEKFYPKTTKEVYNCLSIESTLTSKCSVGGTAPELVLQQIQIAQEYCRES